MLLSDAVVQLGLCRIHSNFNAAVTFSFPLKKNEITQLLKHNVCAKQCLKASGS